MKVQYPPIKYNINPIPEALIYKRLVLGKIHDFSLSTTTEPYKTAVLTCQKTKRYLKNKTEDSLFIQLLKCHPRKQGLGTEMLNFAVKFSKKLGMEGRLHCHATTILSPQEVPHLFYKKFGFNTENSKLNARMDKFIKEGKNGTENEFYDVEMFYPAVEDFIPQKSKAQSLWEKLRGFV